MISKVKPSMKVQRRKAYDTLLPIKKSPILIPVQLTISPKHLQYNLLQ